MKIRALDFNKDIDKIIPLDRYIMPKRTDKTIKEYYKSYKGEIFIAEHDKEIVGYISLSFPHWNKVAYIDHIAVTESRRNQGIGHELVQKAESLAKKKKARIIAVATALWNIKGIDFYKREGFKIKALIPEWLGDKNDLVMLDKKLESFKKERKKKR
jgi:ribosomal protein S18 acetylase RimI-like enzyme